MVKSPSPIRLAALLGIASVALAAPLSAQNATSKNPALGADSDGDGLVDGVDACRHSVYVPRFDWGVCPPMDRNPFNDPIPECRARERVLDTLSGNGAFTTHIAFAVVIDGRLHFADGFEYVGSGQWVHDPQGVDRLYRVGSTSKAITATVAKILEERGQLALDDYVSDDDGSQEFGGDRTLRHLLSHRGAFKIDAGALHLFCYPGSLIDFWLEPDDSVSPHYDSGTYGNLGGGYEYSAFNYSLAGAHLTHRSGLSFAELLQTTLFDPAGMCTASTDGARAVGTSIGNGWGVSESAVMHVGPYINLVAPSDSRCVDNFYSSEDLPGDNYTYQVFHLDEASAVARDPAGGVIASVIDMAHFAEVLLHSYHTDEGLLSRFGVRELWTATTDFGCDPNCAYEPYYGLGFFTDSLDGGTVHQVGHGGSRAGYSSAFVLRPEDNVGISILANADVSTVTMSNLAKAILDDFGG